jgi:hypothetical protein
MPYVDPKIRLKLDPHIEKLATTLLADRPFNLDGAGHLNYAITRLLMLTAFPEGRLSYSGIALVTGVLENVSQEFYRRVAAPYEHQKMLENGDVY